ncbi:MAG: ZIP family metal transporter [Thermoleophilaceae bacterium]
MSQGTTVLLGAIAGGTIFLGLPLARLEKLSASTRTFLATVSAGILLFLFWDVVSQGWGLVENVVDKAKDGGPAGPVVLRVSLFVGAFVIGIFGISFAEKALFKRQPPKPAAGGSAATAEAAGLDGPAIIDEAKRAALSLGMLIAAAIGIHNFSEGLAIGVSARAGEVTLAGTLIVGFALHNATEGFGIVGPLHDVKPSWRWLIAAGLIGGGPTFLGTIVGYRVSSDPLQLAFFALAAGAILFVVGELWGSGMRHASRNLVLAGIVIGFLAGYGTDLVIAYAGA